jgi:hypothetical protein
MDKKQVDSCFETCIVIVSVIMAEQIENTDQT